MSTAKTNRERLTECRWGLYAIIDSQACPRGRSHAELANAALAGGARVIQLRDKTSAFEDLVAVGGELRRLTRTAGATFIVNDNPYLAREVDADGVHLGQKDFPPFLAREILGEEKIIGLSTHTRQEAMDSRKYGVDYIGVGPVYPTLSKASEYQAVGTSMIEWVKTVLPIPVVAIGGITRASIAEVIAAGADNVAVIKELMDADDVAARARELSTAIEQARKKRDASMQ